MRRLKLAGVAFLVGVCSISLAGGQAPQGAGAEQAGPAQGGRGRGGGRGGRGGVEPVIVPHPHDLSGYWMLPPDGRDGRRIPIAQLVPAVTRQKLDAVAKHDLEATRYCHQIGLPTMMTLGSPYNIKISPTLMVIVSEYAAAQNRWIYLNRARHIETDAFDPALYGDSIGHWEGDTLVVESTMFDADRGILGIPGGGFRTADSKLVERFSLMKMGQVLSVVSTWTDPKVFRAPHTYELRYNRLSRDYEGRQGSGCDPYDDERTTFLLGR
jgi:hypothetical protein